MCLVARFSAVCTSSAVLSCRCRNLASPVSTVLMERSSQSRLKWKPASVQRFSSAFILSRASGQSAQILASARSPFESLVPPLLTRLKMSTTTSSVLSAPVTSST